MTKGAQIAVGATVISLLLGWFATTNLESGATFTYYESLQAFQADPANQAGEHARVHGYVAEKSIDRDLSQMQVRFTVQNDPPHAGGPIGDTLPVLYASLETPDLFKDGAEVVVEGRLVAGADGSVFHADKLMAKCPSKFEAQAAAGETEPAA